MDRFEMLMKSLGKYGEEILSSVKDIDQIREIRLSYGSKPLLRIDNDRKIYIGKRIEMFDIKEIFDSLCEYSVHSYIREIREGYITTQGGFRVGICGTAVYDDNNISNIKDISSLNIRFPHEVIGFADEIIPYSEIGGILIIGPPCSGKTTLLRDFSRKISENKFTVIVDERMEIAGIYRGKPSFDIGQASVLNGFEKSVGIKIAARTMAPEFIICDEFGDEADISSALFAMKSGVNIAASIHAFDWDDFITKPFADIIIKKGIFRYFCFLNRKCEIESIKKWDEIHI